MADYIDVGNLHAAPGVNLNETNPLQARQRLAYGRTTHGQLGAEFVLGHHGPGRQTALDDHFFNGLKRHIGERSNPLLPQSGGFALAHSGRIPSLWPAALHKNLFETRQLTGWRRGALLNQLRYQCSARRWQELSGSVFY